LKTEAFFRIVKGDVCVALLRVFRQLPFAQGRFSRLPGAVHRKDAILPHSGNHYR
jgi:hypothetical protein